MIAFSPQEALDTLDDHSHPFISLFKNASCEIEVYKPDQVDLQTPHDRDELYVVIAGKGTFYCDGERRPFQTGDILFVDKGIDHRFEDFSEDFSTWVIFINE